MKRIKKEFYNNGERNALLTDTNNRETLVSKNTLLANITARPIRTSVSEGLGEGDRTSAGRLGLLETVNAKDSTHFGGKWVAFSRSPEGGGVRAFIGDCPTYLRRSFGVSTREQTKRDGRSE
jgi:hypothetical protein